MELINFVLRFFIAKKMCLLTAIVCWPPEETAALLRRGGASGVRARAASARRPPALPAYDVRREAVLLDLQCPGSDDVLRTASASRAFIHRYSWLLLDGSPLNSSTIAARLADVEVLPDADVIWSATDGSADVYKLKEGAGQPVVITPFDLQRNYSLGRMETAWNRWPTSVTRRKDLKNVYLKAATLITQPQNFKGWDDLSDRQIDTFPKLTYPLMMLLSEDLHFRYNMRQVDLYGEQHNGSFDGLAGLLQRHEVEIATTTLFMRADRWRVLHFSAETVELKGAFIFRQPPQSAVTNVFLLPFSRGVWAACGVVLLLAAALLAATSRRLRAANEQLQQLTVPECFLFAIGTICQQGSPVAPAVASVRLVMLSTLVSSLFAFTAYSAKVVAILQTPSDAIQTIDDLARSHMLMAVQDTTYKHVYFAESSEPATQRLYRRKLLPRGDLAYVSVAEGVAQLRTGLVAFQVEQSSGYEVISKTFSEYEKCGLQEIQAFKLPMVAVPIRRHAGVRELVAARLRWQREVGLTSQARRRWLAARPRCDAGAGGFLSIGLTDVLPAVQVLAAGAALAAALLAAELAFHSLHKQKLNLHDAARAGDMLP